MSTTASLVANHQLATHIHRLETVNRVDRYIQDHLGEPIGLDDVACAVGMSKFHLHRVFEEYSGATLGRYLIAARLRAALNLLWSPEARSSSVLDVALQVGFEDPSAFSRSFHRAYGLTPTALRQGHRPREFPLFRPSAGGVALDHGVTIVWLPELWVYGYEVRGQQDKAFAKEAPQGFKVAWDTMLRHGIEVVGGPFGAPSYSWVLPDEACTYLCAFRASCRLSLPGLKERAIPAGNWLRARHVGPINTRWQTWGRLKLQQLRLGCSVNDREPFEEDLHVESRVIGLPCCDVYFPC